MTHDSQPPDRQPDPFERVVDELVRERRPTPPATWPTRHTLRHRLRRVGPGVETHEHPEATDTPGGITNTQVEATSGPAVASVGQKPLFDLHQTAEKTRCAPA